MSSPPWRWPSRPGPRHYGRRHDPSLRSRVDLHVRSLPPTCTGPGLRQSTGRSGSRQVPGRRGAGVPGQRRGGELLRHAETGAGPPAFRDPRRRPPGDLRLDHLLQPDPVALSGRVLAAGQIRAGLDRQLADRRLTCVSRFCSRSTCRGATSVAGMCLRASDVRAAADVRDDPVRQKDATGSERNVGGVRHVKRVVSTTAQHVLSEGESNG